MNGSNTKGHTKVVVYTDTSCPPQKNCKSNPQICNIQADCCISRGPNGSQWGCADAGVTPHTLQNLNYMVKLLST